MIDAYVDAWKLFFLFRVFANLFLLVSVYSVESFERDELSIQSLGHLRHRVGFRELDT